MTVNDILGKGSTAPQRIAHWPRIVECVQHGDAIALTANKPGVRAALRFNPTNQHEGEYTITYVSEHRHEGGRIEKVTSVDKKLVENILVSMLKPFRYRYVVRTTANDRQGTQMIWIVGINAFQGTDD